MLSLSPVSNGLLPSMCCHQKTLCSRTTNTWYTLLKALSWCFSDWCDFSRVWKATLPCPVALVLLHLLLQENSCYCLTNSKNKIKPLFVHLPHHSRDPELGKVTFWDLNSMNSSGHDGRVVLEVVVPELCGSASRSSFPSLVMHELFTGSFFSKQGMVFGMCNPEDQLMKKRDTLELSMVLLPLA